jgi:ABC-type Fe3+/spermidine/putrescine transport system ATPase subunit
MAILIETIALRKCYGTQPVLHEVSLRIPPGALTVIIGPSGCGKSTLLRVLGGFVRPDAGQVRFDGTPVTHLPPEARPTALMFQHYALWPHLSVFAHIAYGLWVRRWERARIEQRVAAILDLVGLRGMEQRRPGQLSGGQQQRVALARALAVEPEVLLLDEPLSNLDPAVRADLRVELRALQRRLGITTVYVTHDQEEALSLADQLVVIQAGRVIQVGAPTTIYQRPASPFVARFVGRSNLLPAVIRQIVAGEIRISPPDRPDDQLALPAHVWSGDRAPVVGQSALLACKPEHLRCSVPGTTTPIHGVVREASFRGAFWSLGLASNWGDVWMQLPAAGWPDAAHEPGAQIGVTLDSAQVILFPPI